MYHTAGLDGGKLCMCLWYFSVLHSADATKPLPLKIAMHLCLIGTSHSHHILLVWVLRDSPV